MASLVGNAVFELLSEIGHAPSSSGTMLIQSLVERETEESDPEDGERNPVLSTTSSGARS